MPDLDAEFAFALLHGRMHLMQAVRETSQSATGGRAPSRADQLAARTEAQKIAGIDQLREFIRQHS